jgi:hypothetical protein
MPDAWNSWIVGAAIATLAATRLAATQMGNPFAARGATKPKSKKPASASKTHPNALQTVRASDVKMGPVRWLWPERIARGKLTVYAGDPGLAKSTIAISIASYLTGKGRFENQPYRIWPDGAISTVEGSVIFLSAEDDPTDTLVPRLKAAGADLNRIHIVQSVLTGSYYTSGADEERLFPSRLIFIPSTGNSKSCATSCSWSSTRSPLTSIRSTRTKTPKCAAFWRRFEAWPRSTIWRSCSSPT